MIGARRESRDFNRIRMPPLGTPLRRILIRVPALAINVSPQGTQTRRPDWMIQLPPLLLKASTVDRKGLGVFPAPNGVGTRRDAPNPVPIFKRGDYITEYGGKTISHEEACLLRMEVFSPESAAVCRLCCESII